MCVQRNAQLCTMHTYCTRRIYKWMTNTIYFFVFQSFFPPIFFLFFSFFYITYTTSVFGSVPTTFVEVEINFLFLSVDCRETCSSGSRSSGTIHTLSTLYLYWLWLCLLTCCASFLCDIIFIHTVHTRDMFFLTIFCRRPYAASGKREELMPCVWCVCVHTVYAVATYNANKRAVNANAN